ncbi:hypothetical protein CWC29_011985 [Pseudoalteromonas sp. S4498]|uniref:carbohydrate binding domain-containing protein n=1 Tax=Pseudoalteromonas galatheae TaxID=579562 RepID=UPI001108A840|nr:carbohydrate binding domain-containing protein [Pseudoalteromonas galatheae]NKC19552.1 hypothetical protein [Pseudoalteromonas galatheae]
MRFLLLLLAIAFSGCSYTQSNLKPKQWRFATDPHGSQAILNGPLVDEEQVAIQFKRVPRVDKQNNSWVELIYDLPTKQLPYQFNIALTYKSDNALIVKLSQREYGGSGDRGYAHYQTKLPASSTWQTINVSLNDFARPNWTPAWSKDKGVILKHVSALYLVPDLTDAEGGEASLAIKSLRIE